MTVDAARSGRPRIERSGGVQEAATVDHMPFDSGA